MSDESEKRETPAAKKVDEEWKRQVQEEKRRLETQEHRGRAPRAGAAGPGGPAGPPPPKPTFAQFISSLATQVLMSLGEMENPVTGRRQVDLVQAQHTIDLLELLGEKTKDNLTPQEENFLTNALHDLRLRYVRAASGGAPTSEPQR